MEKIGAKTIGGGSSNKSPGGGSSSKEGVGTWKRPTTCEGMSDPTLGIGAGSGD